MDQSKEPIRTIGSARVAEAAKADVPVIDVRPAAMYEEGHIPGAVNVPLQQIGSIAAAVPEAATPLFVYCMSGARSQQAVGALKQMGYTDARNIGGIGSWRGDVER